MVDRHLFSLGPQVTGNLKGASWIAGRDSLGPRGEQVVGLAFAELPGRVGLEQVVDPRGATADLPLLGLDQLYPRNGGQKFAGLGPYTLGMGEVTRIVIGELNLDWVTGSSLVDRAEQFHDVARSIRE